MSSMKKAMLLCTISLTFSQVLAGRVTFSVSTHDQNATAAVNPLKMVDYGLVVWACVRQPMLDPRVLDLLCTEEIPLSSAGKPNGDLRKLRNLFSRTLTLPDPDNRGWFVGKPEPVSVAQLVSYSLQANESNQPEDKFTRDAKEQLGETWQESYANFSAMFHRPAAILQGVVDGDSPLAWRPYQRWALCYGPSRAAPTENPSLMNLNGCTGFWRDSENYIGLLEQLEAVDDHFSDPEELASAREEVRKAIEETQGEIPTDRGAFMHSVTHVMQIYSGKISVIVLGHVLHSAALLTLGHVLLITLPYSLYILGRDGKLAWKANQRMKKFAKLVEISEGHFILPIEPSGILKSLMESPDRNGLGDGEDEED